MEQTHILPGGARLIVPTLRSDVPVYVPPDRDTWPATHQGAAFPLGTVQAKYLSRVLVALQRDSETLSFTEAIAAHERISQVCARVHADLHLPESTLVFFDSQDRQFWAYPA